MEPEQQKRILMALGGVVAVLAVVLGVVVLTRSGDDTTSTASTSSSSSTSTSSSSSTSTTAASTTSTTLAAADLDASVFPDLSSGAVGFDDPVALAKAYAVQVLGFDDSVLVGAYHAGDSRSGEVEVRPNAGADPTVVLVRMLSDGSWAVIAAHTDSIRLDTPVASTPISSPQPLLGAAQAFEGHVNVTLYADGQEVAIANTFVLGGGDAMAAFSGQLTFTVPKGATRGVLVLSAAGGQDGSTVAAMAIRVRF